MLCIRESGPKRTIKVVANFFSETITMFLSLATFAENQEAQLV